MNSTSLLGPVWAFTEHSVYACVFILGGLWWFFSVLADQAALAVQRRASLTSGLDLMGDDESLRHYGHASIDQPDRHATLGRCQAGRRASTVHTAILLISVAGCVAHLIGSRFHFSEEIGVNQLHAAMLAFFAFAAASTSGIVKLARYEQYLIHSMALAVNALLWTAQLMLERFQGSASLHAFLALLYALLSVSTLVECFRPETHSASNVRPSLLILIGTWHSVCGTTEYTDKFWWQDAAKLGSDSIYWHWTASAIFFSWTVFAISLLLVVFANLGAAGLIRKRLRLQEPTFAARQRRSNALRAWGRMAINPCDESAAAGRPDSVFLLDDCLGSFVGDAETPDHEDLSSARRLQNEPDVFPLQALRLSPNWTGTAEHVEQALSSEESKKFVSTKDYESSLASCDISAILNESSNAVKPQPIPVLSVSSAHEEGEF